MRRARRGGSGASGGGVGSQSRRRRHTSSLTQAIWRPAVETASMSASASAKPERGRHLVLVLQEQLVVLAAGHAVQLDPDVGEERGRVLERCQVGVVGQQRRVGGDGAQHADVAQAAVALLEVGLEEEGDVPGGGAALGHLDLEQRAGTSCRAASRHAARAFSRSGSATLGSPQTMRPSRRPSATRTSSAAALRTSEGRRTEWSRCTPSSQTGYQMPSATARMSPVAVVDEDHIEVAVGAQRAAAVAAHGHQGQVPLAVAGRPVGQAGEPGVRLGGVAPAEFLALQAGLGQQAAPPVTQ